MHPRIGIVTFKGDLHSVAVSNLILNFDTDVRVHVFYVDNLSSHAGAFFSSINKYDLAFLSDSNGEKVILSSLNTVWWRRCTFPQLDTTDLSSDEVALINRDSQLFIEGLFIKHVQGKWVNHPWHARAAENKIIQLASAMDAGLKVPRTLVTNDPQEISMLLKENKPYIVKSLAGLPGKSLLTQSLTAELGSQYDSIKLSPACYQEYVAGSRHLRILVAGLFSEGIEISSEHIDSRIDFSGEAKPYKIPINLAEKLQNVLTAMNLAMGVFDLKINVEGEIIFLEVNQQGQFLYLDAMAEVGFVKTLSEFLVAEALNASLNIGH